MRIPEALTADSARRAARSLALVYGIVAAAWIGGSSTLAAWVLPSREQLAHVELIKGALFVLVTAGLLHLLAGRWLRRLAETQQRLVEQTGWMQMAIDGSHGAHWSLEVEARDALGGRAAAWRERIVAEDRERVADSWRRCVRGEAEDFDVTYRIGQADGALRWLRSRGRLQRDAGGRAARWSGIDWDVTAEQRGAEDLRLAAKVFESSSEGVLVMDAQERIAAVNQAYTRITGYTLDDVRGRSPVQFLSSARNVDLAPEVRAAVHERGYWRGDYSGHRRDGRAYSASLIISAVIGEGGEATHFVGILSDVTELAESRAQLEQLRQHDGLTGLPTEALFLERIAESLRLAAPNGGALTLALLDLSRFHAVNDNLGRRAGDNVLIELAARLAALPGVAHISRIAGDRFALCRDGDGSLESAQHWGQQVLAEISRSFGAAGSQVHLSACLGLCVFPLHGGSADELMRRASSALAEARRAGPGTILCYRADMSERSMERLRLESALRTALEAGELQCHFQPKVDLATSRWIGAEALVRWPRAGAMVPPDRFLPVAGDAGLLPELDRWMLHTACSHVARWLAEGVVDRDFCLSVNVSAAQVGPPLVEQVRRELEQSGLPGASLELELTEQLIMAAPERASQVLVQLRELGVRIAIDDFGTGYSSLSYLHRLPIDSLKIDRCFIADLPERAEAMAVVRSIIALGRNLRLRLVAEGVETERQRRTVMEMGCDEAQGYLYSAAVTAPRFAELLKATRAGARPVAA